MKPLLKVENLTLSLSGKIICSNINFSLYPNQTMGIVGKSGAGKSVLIQALLQLNRAKVLSGKVFFQSLDILCPTYKQMKTFYKKKIGFIFQDAFSSLNPTMKVGEQIIEAIADKKQPYRQIKKRVLLLMQQVGIAHEEKKFEQYPFELSGGICQRICIAIALALKPELIILDEPTTALDSIIQRQVLDLIQKACKKNSISLLFVTHDLGIIAKICDRVLVLEKGKIIEKGPVEKILLFPSHPHTKKLLSASNHHFKTNVINCIFPNPLILEVKDLYKNFSCGKKNIQALRGTTLEIPEKSTLALVGESGCGKTTLAKILVKLLSYDSGQIQFCQKNLQKYPEKTLRKEMQIILQNPFSSLNPLMNIRQILSEPFLIQKTYFSQKTLEDLLQDIHLSPLVLDCYPHELSGGERQRICIARALSLKPKFLILDEPTSALDVFSQKQILTLLKYLQKKYGLTYLFITHNLSLIKNFADSLAVMYLGKIIEKGPCDKLFHSPHHPYTQLLLSSILSTNPLIEKNTSSFPFYDDIKTPSDACCFYPKCPQRLPICKTQKPPNKITHSHEVHCHLMHEKDKINEETKQFLH